jgi:hypothetical protein
MQLIGTYSDRCTKNTKHQKEFNGYTNAVLRNYQQENVYTGEITSTIRDAHRVGTRWKTMTISSNALREEINLMRNRVDPRLCNILQEGLLTYFNGESVTNAMLRIREQEGYGRYDLLIEEQTVIGWDNLLRGKFSKQWKIQQKAYVTRRKLGNPFLYEKTQRRKARELAKNY